MGIIPRFSSKMALESICTPRHRSVRVQKRRRPRINYVVILSNRPLAPTWRPNRSRKNVAVWSDGAKLFGRRTGEGRYRHWSRITSNSPMRTITASPEEYSSKACWWFVCPPPFSSGSASKRFRSSSSSLGGWEACSLVSLSSLVDCAPDSVSRFRRPRSS